MRSSIEISRIRNLIESDRVSINDNFCLLIESDLKKLLKDYFDLNSNVSLKISKISNGLEITVTTTASRIKTFQTLPND